MLEKEDINLSSCNQLLKENFEEIKKLQKLWKEMTKYLEYRKKWSFYYAWYAFCCAYFISISSYLHPSHLNLTYPSTIGFACTL